MDLFTPKYITQDRADTIIGKLNAEDATDLSDETLDRILSRCVAGHRLPMIAKHMRDIGMITIKDLIN